MVGSGVLVGVGVSVGMGVNVAVAVAVGSGVFVNSGVAVALAALPPLQPATRIAASRTMTVLEILFIYVTSV